MKTREYVPSQTDAPVADVCVSFNGGAWRGVFFLGVVRYLQTHFKEEELRRWSFCGVSAGSCYALALALNVPFQRLRTLLLEACRRARESPLGVAFQVNVITGEIIRQMLASYSEEDVVSRLRGRFAVTFTARLGCRLVPLPRVRLRYQGGGLLRYGWVSEHTPLQQPDRQSSSEHGPRLRRRDDPSRLHPPPPLEERSVLRLLRRGGLGSPLRSRP